MRISDWGSDVCASVLPDLRLEAVLAHQPPDFLMVDDDALVPERGPHAAVSVGLEGVADGGHGRNDPGVVDRQLRHGVIRSEERRVGKEWGSTCRSRWTLCH